jgi:UDP-N-acetylmuramate--alanine ligase
MAELINIKDIRKACFIGVGGIGMSAIARYFLGRGVAVWGYDKTPTALTATLQAEGVSVHFDDDPALFPTDADIVVYTPAIPASNRLFNHCKALGISLLKRSDVLQIISRGCFNICIAGTHGKTTTSAMVGHVLRDAGHGCNAFLGGISSNYNTNFWSHANDVCVIEADEYDRSFLKLFPDVISISSMDPDHLDIYGTPEAMEDAFIQFTTNLKQGGLLLHKKGIPREAALHADLKWTYSASDMADIAAKNCRAVDGVFHYDVEGPGWKLSGLSLHMGGVHNVENSLVAIAIAMHLGIDPDKIKKAIDNFRGVKRRFEYIIKSPQQVYIDDYAHHPEELKALITGARAMFPDRKCTVIFQPHLYSRTRDLATGFAESLDLADDVYLLPIYPARELPIAGVESDMIAKMMHTHVTLLDMHQVVEKVAAEKPVLLITAGAGNIDTLVGVLKNKLKNEA